MRYFGCIQSALRFPSTYWIVIKRSRASDRAHCPVIHSSSDHFTFVCAFVCVCACRRKKNKPPLIHVFPPSLTITWKRRGPKPGSTINQISPSRKNVPSSILWNCCVSCHKGIRRGKMNRENCCKKKSYESDFTNANQGDGKMENLIIILLLHTFFSI